LKYSRSIRKHLESIRAAEWWEYKLVPIFAAFYGTALLLEVPVSTLWPAALTVLLSLVPGAAYVSVINDFTDRDDDARAGKPNRLTGRSGWYVALLLGLTSSAGLVFVYLWRGDRLLLSAYLAAWLAYSLYSLPPFRWKARGILGVVADASGAHLFPTTVAVVLAFRGAGREIDVRWLTAVALWSLAYGFRGILWHQLIDVENDRKSSVRTFVERHSPMLAARIGTFVAFPLEMLALLAMLIMLKSPLPYLLLGFYALLVWLRVRSWQMNIVIVMPRPRFLIFLHEYYDVFLPFAILVASSLRHPSDWIAVAIHLILFRRRPLQSLDDAVRLFRMYLP